jgi:tetratricopeptide (TPR) repeat protein
VPTLLAQAEAALRRGDAAGAVSFLAQVVAVQPTAPGVARQLDQFIATCDDPLALVPLTANTSYGTAAIRAYALGKRGFIPEGFALLRRLARTDPAKPVIDYALPWLDAGCLSESETREAVLLFLNGMRMRFPEIVVTDPAGRAVLQRWLPHVQRFRQAARDDETLRNLLPTFLRKAGYLDDALACAREAYAHAPDLNTAVALANACRANGDENGWHEACLEALRLDPENNAVRLDLGDGLWERLDRPAEAERWYAEVLAREPEHPWALPSLLALRYLRAGEIEVLDKLEAFAAAQPTNARARAVVASITTFS